MTHARCTSRFSFSLLLTWARNGWQMCKRTNELQLQRILPEVPTFCCIFSCSPRSSAYGVRLLRRMVGKGTVSLSIVSRRNRLVYCSTMGCGRVANHVLLQGGVVEQNMRPRYPGLRGQHSLLCACLLGLRTRGAIALNHLDGKICLKFGFSLQ